MRTSARFILSALVLSPLLVSCGRSPEPDRRPARATVRLTGKALEQVDSPPYTFIRLGTASGEQWVAVPIGKVGRSGLVTITNAVPLKNFEVGPGGRRVEVVYLGEMEQQR
jgi:hypothetical protein